MRLGPSRRMRRSGLVGSWRGTAGKLRGPLYAAAGAGTAFEGGFGHSGSGRQTTVSVAVRHVRDGGELDIDTSDEPAWDDGADGDWWLVTDWLHRAVRPGSVVFPLTLTANRWEQQIPVDGVAVPFVFVGDKTVWCALGTVNRRQVSVVGTGWPHDGLTLAAVSPRDVSPVLPERC